MMFTSRHLMVYASGGQSFKKTPSIHTVSATLNELINRFKTIPSIVLAPCERPQAGQQFVLDLLPEVFADGGSPDGAAVQDRDEDVRDDPLNVPQQVLGLPCIDEPYSPQFKTILGFLMDFSKLVICSRLLLFQVLPIMISLCNVSSPSARLLELKME